MLPLYVKHCLRIALFPLFTGDFYFETESALTEKSNCLDEDERLMMASRAQKEGL